ncbi:MAG: DNA repair protein RecN [Rhodocyclaceae bacterium]|nr:DNA repair protein RecN [Rhodocyclaceae bacterium]
MLLRLSIRDFVIVDRLELEFPSGFGALTGETGAGKSILIDALSLALGARADASIVRSGADKADIAAEFSFAEDSPVRRWLLDNDFEAETCLLRRVIDQQGRSRAWINGVAATLTQLRELGAWLCDIHGQHAHHRLLHAEAQRQLLDEQAGASTLARAVAMHYSDWREARAALAEAERDREAMAQERELLAWQIKELEALAFDLHEWREIEAEQRRLSHAASLLEAVDLALALIEEEMGERREAVLDALQRSSARLHELSQIDAQLAEPAELLAGACVELTEAAHALRRYRERLDLDPQRLLELDRRIEAVVDLARKHRVAPEELPERLASLRARLDALSRASDPEHLARAVEAAEAAYREAAEKLSQARRATAEKLASAVTAAMQELAMAGGRFEIALTPLAEPSAQGLEAVEFRVAANQGQNPQPLAKVASGGELSRIGLALMVIASQARAVETMIFDEVDVGIGGRVGEIVGRLLRELGRTRQVLCVTHLPQVAACADWQWSVGKETRAGMVTTRLVMLDHAGRVEEIARMLGGMKITDTTRQHAREMLGG